jgi:putative membrane protein
MMLRWFLATVHLLALGIGLGAVWIRGRGLKSALTPADLRRVFSADNTWGLAAVLWISTGLWRLLGGVEKSTAYYLHNHIFLTKMGLFLLILILEIWPMATLIRWRKRIARGELPDTRAAPLLARISLVQAGLIVLMVFAAAGMARGIGA